MCDEEWVAAILGAKCMPFISDSNKVSDRIILHTGINDILSV